MIPLSQIASSIASDHPGRCRLLLAMLDAALQAIEPAGAVARALADREIAGDQIAVLALGKAAPAMARGAVSALGSRADPVLVVSDDRSDVKGAEIILSSHPIPDRASVRAGRRLLEVAAERHDHVLFLISGGGSALAELPVTGLTLEDLVETHRLLVGSGLPIEQMNTVRAHMSALKGGRLGASVRGATTTMVISDVGPRPHLVASGPTVPCPTSPAHALVVLEESGLVDRVPPGVVAALESAGNPPPLAQAEVVVVADGVTAARAARDRAERGNVPASVVTTELDGSAPVVARTWMTEAVGGVVSILAGETTVEVTGTGVGGRNQEAALSAAVAIEGTDTLFAAFGTDGIDGPTDAAGAVVDGSTIRRLRKSGIDPGRALADNDSHTALDAASALIRCGRTGTNVADLWLIDRR